MPKEKPTKTYTASKKKAPKKQGPDFFEQLIKSVKFVVSKAMAGSVQHIAVLVAGVVLTVAVVGGAVWGISAVVGSGSAGPDIQEIEIDPEADNKYDKNAATIDTSKYASTILPETADAGQQYISETLFVGDSNTVRSLMYDVTGNTWENVVGAVGIGIQHVASNPFACVTFTQPADPVDIVTAIKWIQPKRVVFTFGTNNASWTVESFIEEYKKAIDAAYEAYPYFDVIVNAIPPVHKVRDYPNVTMQQIDAFNAALAQMCEEEGYKFLNSAEVLKDETTGFAKEAYTIGDGIHLSKEGFTALFNYIRTHAYETEDRRPELTYCPKRNEVEMPTIIQDPVPIRGGLKVIFTSNDYELGSVDGEVEQYVKYTQTSDAVVAIPKSDAKFTGWSCEYGGISDPNSATITFTAPMLDESITEVRVVANFKKDKPDPTPTPVPTKAPEATATPAVLQSISFKDNATKGEINVGSSVELTVVANPASAQLGTVTWTSSDTGVATVAANGTTNKVSGVKAGTATITASVNGGKLKATYTVTVKDPNAAAKLTSIVINPVTVEKGKTATLNVTCNPSNATVASKTYSTSDTSVATINKDGVITGVKEGTATITATFDGIVGTTTVTVTAHTHSYTETVTKQPTCTAVGEKTFKCSCGDTKTEEIAATGHSYSESVTKQPTCTAAGEKTLKCSCGDTKTEEIAATGHSYSETVTNPTCTADGSKTKTCSSCGATSTETISATGHSWSESTVNPTCTSNGSKTKTCSGCGASESETIPATGHSMADDGTGVQKCTVCGAAG